MHTPSITPSSLYTQLRTLISHDIPVFIHGAPGIGKSYIVADLAKEADLPLIDVRLSQLDAVDLRGIPTVSDDQTLWMPPVFLPRDKESKGILFLDELNSAPPSVQASVYQLILDRKIGEYTLPKGWRIICAGNRINDRGIVFRLPSPLANRMVHLLLDTDYDDFKAWGMKEGVHSAILGFLAFRPDLLSQEVPEESETNPAFCSPRSWTMLSNVLRESNIDAFAPIIYGAVGYQAGVEFLAFIKLYHALPDTLEILEGKSDYIPDTPGGLYAVTAALIEHCKSEHAQNLLRYATLLPVEFNVLLIKDLIIKDPSISELDQFNEWIETYGDHIV